MNKSDSELWLKRKFLLTEKGYGDLKKGIVACTITNFSLMLPFSVSMLIIVEALKPLSGGEVSWGKMWGLLAVGVISTFLIFLFSRNDYRKTYLAAYTESENTRIRLAEHIRELPMSVFNSKDLSELTTNLMNDVGTSERALSHNVPQLISTAISITVICSVLAFLDWRMAFAMFITTPVAFFIIMASRKLQNKLGKKQSNAKLVAYEQIQEYIEGLKVIKSCGLYGEKFSALNNALISLRKLGIRFETGSGAFITAAQMVLQAGIGIVVFVGVSLISNNAIGFIPLLMFLLTVTRVYGPFLVELTLLPELLYYQIAINRMRKLIETPRMDGELETDIRNFTIKFDHVDFSYNKIGEKVIQDISLTILPNSVTALVGPSGSGKSTVLRLISRFWDTNKGSITIGGIDVKTLNPEHLMGYISFVFQDVVLFNDTIYNNIRIGNRNATREEVMTVAKAACCDEFALKLPNGYDSILGENGSTLSGGERQRISIARALLKNAPIILLDESTASLDPENESHIQKAISHLVQGKTVIVIAHKLRTIVEADKIIVLDKGSIVEQGLHEELFKNRSLYHKLYSIQQESMGWVIK